MSALDEARSTLLRALEELDKAAAELEHEPTRIDLVVVYSVGYPDPDEHGAWYEVGGWSSTAGPKWVHSALMRRAAEANDVVTRAMDEGEEDE